MPESFPQRDSNKPIDERAEDPLREGRIVKVRRSNGTIEDGWKIKSFTSNGKVAVLEKAEGRTTIKKGVEVAKLEELNPPVGKGAVPPPSVGFGDVEVAKIAKAEIQGGFSIDSIPAGKTLTVITKNTKYKIERREDGFYISGNAELCPTPTKVQINGSTFGGGSMIKPGFVGLNMNLEFIFSGKVDPKAGPTPHHTTSKIEKLYIEGDEPEVGFN